MERLETDSASKVHPKLCKDIQLQMRDYCDFSTG
jgi:hypothetical protein